VKRSLAWSLLAWVVFAALQVYGIRRQGLNWEVAWNEAPSWLGIWPGFFLTIWFFTSRKSVQKQAFLTGEAAAERALASRTGGLRPSAPCPQCGMLTLLTVERCPSCGVLLRDIQIVHPLELLPGAQRSVPSVLDVLAVIVSMFAGVGTLYLIGEKRFLENDLLMIGGFMGGFSVAMVGSFAVIARWAGPKGEHPRKAA
jgi:hypothetical protein